MQAIQIELYDILGIIVLGTLIILRAYKKIDTKIFVLIGIFFIFIAGIASIFGSSSISNSLAIVAYYCLVVGVALIFVEFLLENRRLAAAQEDGEKDRAPPQGKAF